MTDLVTKVSAARGLTAEIFTAHKGHAWNDWVIIEPIRPPAASADAVGDVNEAGKDGLYADLFRVVVDDLALRIAAGTVVAIVKQLAVKLQNDGDLLAIQHKHIIAVVPDGAL